MNKIVCFLTLSLTLMNFALPSLLRAEDEYSYGDYKSATLVAKAWEAFNKNDMGATFAFTNKCVEMYEAEAKKMQSQLKDFPQGGKDEILSQWWAINDVATAYYIQAETYRKSGMNEMAKSTYEKIIKEFSFGQCWDPQGWFWKPSEAAKEKLAQIK